MSTYKCQNFKYYTELYQPHCKNVLCSTDDARIAKHLVVSSNVTQHGEEDISRELHSKSLLEDQCSSKSGEQSIVLVGSDPGGSIIVHFYVETTAAAEFCLMHIKDGKLKNVLEGVICTLLRNHHETPVTIDQLTNGIR